MKRIMLRYADETATYAYFDESDNTFIIGKEKYTVDELNGVGAYAAVNDASTLKRFGEIGMPCRPTPKQYVLSVAVSETTKERMFAAAKKEGKKASRIIEELAIKWLDENGY